jgi:hypothetical protein
MKRKNITSATLIIIGISFLFYASSTGITGTTLKNGVGCDCHGTTPSNQVLVSISGPDQIEAGEDATYTLTITGGTLTAGGTNIAASAGTLSPENGLKLVGSELTHTSPRQAVSGSVSWTFKYRAPETVGVQTLFANGNSVNLNGQSTGDLWNFAPSKTINVVGVTSVEDKAQITDFYLNQNYPNPFNPSTKISFTLKEAASVKLDVYSSTGEKIAELLNGEKGSGSHYIDFNGEGFASGIYYYKLEANGISEMKKMIMLK